MGKRVLLVEDEPNIIEAIRYVLSREGYDVDTHSDGATAISAVGRRLPDIVILDVMLPNRSGYDILRDLRSEPKTEKLPVLMLTARGQKRDEEMALEFGASHFMTKPFSNNEMVERVRDLTS